MPKYIDCAHPFAYGGVESAMMKKYSADQQVDLMRMQLLDRGITVGANGHQVTVEYFPSFVELYSELFRDTDASDSLVDRNMLAAAR